MRNEFSAICETCGFETVWTENMPTVKILASHHSLRRPGHILIYRTQVIEGSPRATKKR
jgi:hypothetical protein